MPTSSTSARTWSAGCASRVRASAGTTVTLRFAEMLDADGTLYTANLRSARATDHYTCTRRRGRRSLRAALHLSRLPLCRGGHWPGELTGRCHHRRGAALGHGAAPASSSAPIRCSTSCRATSVWGQKGNFLEVPTDCPQRDERLGWTGDAQVFVRTGGVNFDVAPFFAKWLQDLEDAQGDGWQDSAGGAEPATCGGNGGPAWADAGVICPWTIYLCYGDTAILRAALRERGEVGRFTGR